MSSEYRIALFDLLGFVTTALALITAFMSLRGNNWRWIAGVAIAACLVYQVRIILIRPLVK